MLVVWSFASSAFFSSASGLLLQYRSPVRYNNKFNKKGYKYNYPSKYTGVLFYICFVYRTVHSEQRLPHFENNSNEAILVYDCIHYNGADKITV